MLKTIFPAIVAFSFAIGASAQDVAIGSDGARHLLGRSGFAASQSDIRSLATLSRAAAADRLIKSAATSTIAITTPPTWVNDKLIAPAVRQAMSQEERQAEDVPPDPNKE